MQLNQVKNYSFSLNFPISRENRNLELITIRYDMGHPVNASTVFRPKKTENRPALILLDIESRGVGEVGVYT